MADNQKLSAMNSTGDIHPEVQDHETKSDELTNSTRFKVDIMQSKSEVPKPSISDIRRQLIHMQMVSWQIISDIHNNINVVQKNHALYRSNLNKNYRDCHRLLDTEEEMKLVESKKQEDQDMKNLEAKTLQLVHLMEQITITKTKDQLKDIEEKLKTLETPEEKLDISESPLQLRISRQMMHMLKPVPELIQFDPQSAHPNLALSPDFKQVRFEPVPQTKKATSQCFEPGVYVLGTPGFRSGRHYWEVNVGNKSSWIIGIVKESVERKGTWELNSSNGYWVLRKQGDNVYYGIANTCEKLRYNLSPVRIGVCLDLFRSHLVFYDANTTDIIHQMSLCFVKETLLPFFCPGVPMREDDWCPLTICV
ncbi:nuclear factor 7, brain-like isoform X2 [Bufo gargarizans]|uniref:nuclear factor 7, brain-like isoform X2 n=1 Tax=Bufo gargarizans TaxID=30331 RepID=UPI001CF18873|nr:nuclear factor 7, brain-like isoform X2 [Bufo gargarizans]